MSESQADKHRQNRETEREERERGKAIDANIKRSMVAPKRRVSVGANESVLLPMMPDGQRQHTDIDCIRLRSLSSALSELRSCVKVEVAVLGSRP